MFRKVAFAAALLAGLPTAAQADTYQITGYQFDPAALTGTIKYVPTNLSLNVQIGRLKLVGKEVPSNDPVSFLTFCVDIFNTLQPATFTDAPIGTLIPDATRQSRLLALMARANPLIAAASNKSEAAAAMQLAVWEVVNETGPTYGFGTGSFRSSGGNSNGARTLATTWLNNLTTNVWTAPENGSLKLLYSRNSQSQIITAVPEPATWALMIGGFGMVGGMMRRKTSAGIRVSA
jgi:hypothetical protein